MLPQSVSSQRTHLKPMTLRKLGSRRLTRAHQALSNRPRCVADGHAYGDALVAAVAGELGVEGRLEASVLQTRIAPQDDLTEHASVFVVLELSACGATAVLEMDASFVVALLERLAARDAMAQLTPVLRLTALEEASLGFLLLTALAAGRVNHAAIEGPFRPRLQAITADRAVALARVEPRQPHVGIDLRVVFGTLAGALRLLLPAPLLRTVVESYEVARPPSSMAPQVAYTALSMRCVAGPTSLSVAEVSGLRCGDAVVVPGLSLVGGELRGAARLEAPLFTLSGEFAPAGLSVLGALPRARSPESSMSPVDRTELTSPLAVEVEVELTRIRLSLAELSVLQRGALIPLQISASDPVLLRIGERTIARAELVDIEAAVAARILSLNP